MPTKTLSDAAGARLKAAGGPLLGCGWNEAIFIHYEVPPEVLTPFIPFELDLHDGKAYVSLVAFTMRNLRPALWRPVLGWLCRGWGTHRFLNVRTYVRQGGETGIYFLAEWLTSRIAVRLGPPVYGLPYRLGKLEYEHERGRLLMHGRVSAGGTLEYKTEWVDDQKGFEPAPAGSLDEFLMERYTAFTLRHGVRRRFCVWHEPWPQIPVDVQIKDASLIEGLGDWFGQARLVGANYSPGVSDVRMGWPKRIAGQEKHRGLARRRVMAGLPLLVLMSLALLTRWVLPAWGFMCAMTFAILGGCKVMTWLDSGLGWRAGIGRTAAYLFAWPGMNARAFLNEPVPSRPRRREWLAATATTLCGIALLLRLPRVMASSHPWLAGYVAIAALLLTIHFGFFKLLSLLWRHAGWHAAPMMLAPWLSRSLADFWSNRWNLAFRDLTHTYLFRPLVRPLGIAGANLASFILSGLVHELVISLPAGAGFGLPTLYFTIQGLATLIERRLCLPEMLMRVVAIAVVVGPAPLLFHPPFVANVVLPLLRAIRVI